MMQTDDRNPWSRLLPAPAALAALCIGAAAALTLLAHGSRPPAASGEQLALVLQRMPYEAGSALRGDASAFAAFAGSTARAKALRGELAGAAHQADWRAIDEYANTIFAARASVAAIGASSLEARRLAPQLLSQLGDLASAGGVQKLNGMSRNLGSFELTVQRIQQDLSGLAAGVGDAAPAAQRLADSLEFLNQVVRGLSGEETGAAVPPAAGAGAARRLQAFVQRDQQFVAAVRAAIGSAEPLSKAQSALRSLWTSADALASQYAAAPAPGAAGGAWRPWILACLALSLLSLAALAWVYRKAVDLRHAVETRVRANERNQEAIMRLLDELSSLADGDLTVQATVSEDITGAIADSINYAIEALRELVTTINDGAIQLDGATKQAQAAAAHMAKASSAQSRQISAASESMAEMAASIEEVSGNSERSADVARHSVDIAHKGGDAVRRTIDGMNAIRETIQETSKRIKRLGESSQEIGNIVELINDIAEQTNILALNASIQASMAGEAGRGFAVVADEVQRLAERAANATKQIEVLVRTIQTDTNEAVVSMERSTTDVVGGALLAENAGAALEEIEQVSNQIASLVQNISASARQQAMASGNISKNMQVVREISSQTAEGSSATSASIAKLAALAAQLRKSVAGFRLADYGGGTTTIASSSSTRLPALQDPAGGGGDSGKMRKLGGGLGA
ncbi:MAG TPA: methyl-accepting chemotaxis protein [Steroidobacteraceae bacterium]|nr:methyl-accepting chemotaxis protein [Steroidobacteraceae bacterium]